VRLLWRGREREEEGEEEREGEREGEGERDEITVEREMRLLCIEGE